MEKKRCSWANPKNKEYLDYHDKEWGREEHDDNKLFELLILEGAQAGLSWETVLKKREGYRKAFKNFDPKKVARMTDPYLEKQLLNPNIIRNRLKVFSTRKNARIVLELQKEFGSLDSYLWSFVGGKSILSKRKTVKSTPTSTPISDKLSKDLKKRGMSFVGTTIIYAFMQATGMVNDHTIRCFCHPQYEA